MSAAPSMTEPAPNDTERAYAHIRRGIIEGVYPPGARLIESQVSAAVEASRTPVREAIRRLESEGLVVAERNRGAHVRTLDRDTIVDLYDVRARLEGYGAELAAQRATSADIDGLQRAACDFDTAVQRSESHGDGATHALEGANRSFHQSLLVASRHERLPSLVAGAVDAPLVFQALQRFAPQERRRSALFHHLIAEAVAARDSARAGRLLIEHILQGRDALLGALDGLAGDIHAGRNSDGADNWLRSIQNPDAVEGR